MGNSNPWEKDINKESIRVVDRNKNDATFNIDVKRVFRIWPLAFLLCIIGAFGGLFYSRYIYTNYTFSTKLNLQQKEEISLTQALNGSTRDPFNDRIAYLKSPSLILSVVNNLKLNYRTTLIGKLKNKDLYGKFSWYILNNKKPEKPLQFIVEKNTNNKGYKLVYSNKTISNFEFGKPFLLDSFIIQVNKNSNINTYTSPIEFSFNQDYLEAVNVSNKLSIKASSESNIIDILYVDNSKEKGLHILKELINTYNLVLQNDKTREFSEIISFINNRISPLNKELDSIENEFVNYQSSKGYVSEKSNGEILVTEMIGIQNKLNDLEVETSNLDTLIQHLDNAKDANSKFNGLIIGDNTISNQIQQLNELVIQKNKLIKILTPANNDIVILDLQIKAAKKDIYDKIKSYYNNLSNTKQFYKLKLENLKQEIKKTPFNEKDLNDYKRLRNIKEALFLVLLQKREEAAIAKAAAITEIKVLFPPELIANTEKYTKLYWIFLFGFIGILLPFAVAAGYELTHNKLVSSKQIAQVSIVPILGELSLIQSSAKSKLSNNRFVFEEQLRTLRTQLSFYKTDSALCILLTSNVSGEGKSFLSLNLAKIFAIQDKKVALLELDLRKPKISKELDIHHSKGVSKFLLDKHTTIDQIIVSVDNLNFDFFPAGTIPPNPQELLSNNRMGELINYIKSNYDIIILDSPPLGIVSDAQILAQFADISLIVTRFNYSKHEYLHEINKWKDAHYFKSMAIVFNGIKNEGYYGYYYKNYYYKNKYYSK